MNWWKYGENIFSVFTDKLNFVFLKTTKCYTCNTLKSWDRGKTILKRLQVTEGFTISSLTGNRWGCQDWWMLLFLLKGLVFASKDGLWFTTLCQTSWDNCQSVQSFLSFSVQDTQFLSARLQKCRSFCNNLKLSVWFLFMFLYIYYFSLSAQHHLLSVFHIPRFCQFLHSCSPVMSVCSCEIWAWAHPESASSLFGHFQNSGIFLDFVHLSFSEFPAAGLICIIIISP